MAAEASSVNAHFLITAPKSFCRQYLAWSVAFHFLELSLACPSCGNGAPVKDFACRKCGHFGYQTVRRSNKSSTDDCWNCRNGSPRAFATSFAKTWKFLRLADSRKRKRWGLGRCYVVGAKGVIDKNVDLEKLARDLKASEPRETLK
jgi:hypothetical protein